MGMKKGGSVECTQVQKQKKAAEAAFLLPEWRANQASSST
jgi:hypothetical protein